MKYPPILLKTIRQKNNHTFTIEWSDGIVHDYRLSSLQQKCPCAKCHAAQAAGQAVGGMNDDVRAVRLTNVGRYALRVQFTSGCSTGIYSYAMLREMGREMGTEK